MLTLPSLVALLLHLYLTAGGAGLPDEGPGDVYRIAVSILADAGESHLRKIVVIRPYALGFVKYAPAITIRL